MRSAPSEFETKHERNVPRQPGAGVRRRSVVVVVVEIYRGTDQPKIAGNRKIGPGYGWVVGKIQRAGITELNMVEDIERLHGELKRQVFCQLSFLSKREVD